MKFIVFFADSSTNYCTVFRISIALRDTKVVGSKNTHPILCSGIMENTVENSSGITVILSKKQWYNAVTPRDTWTTLLVLTIH